MSIVIAIKITNINLSFVFILYNGKMKNIENISRKYETLIERHKNLS
jgi:hypothetical protein